MSPAYIIKEVTYVELPILEGHQPPSVTYFIPMSFINPPTAYECTRGIFSPPQDSHWSISTILFIIFTLSTHLEDKTTLPSTFFSSLIISTSYTKEIDLLKFK